MSNRRPAVSVRRWVGQGDASQQTERVLTLVFALLRVFQTVQFVVLLSIPIKAGTMSALIVAVVALLVVETTYIVARAVHRGCYTRQDAVVEASTLVLCLTVVMLATPPEGRVDAAFWLFPPSLAMTSGFALALRLRPLVLCTLLIDALYALPALLWPVSDSPLRFNLSAVTALPALALLSFWIAHVARGMGHQLVETTAQLQQALRQASEAAAETARLTERQDQSNFLHDIVVQVLETAHERLRSQPGQQDLVAELGRAARRCRLYLLGENPLAVDSLQGLLGELEELGAERGVRLITTDARRGSLLAPSHETLRDVYLVAREVVHNMAKHASASTAYLRVSCRDDHLRLTFARHGRGYDPQLVRHKYGWAVRSGVSVRVHSEDEAEAGELVEIAFS